MDDRNRPDLAEGTAIPLKVPVYYVDAAQLHVQPFSLHLIFGATSGEGGPVPRIQLTMSPTFANHLREVLGQALASYNPTPPGGA